MDEKIIMEMLKTGKASIHADINPRVKESRIMCEGRGIDILVLSMVIVNRVIERLHMSPEQYCKLLMQGTQPIEAELDKLEKMVEILKAMSKENKNDK